MLDRTSKGHFWFPSQSKCDFAGNLSDTYCAAWAVYFNAPLKQNAIFQSSIVARSDFSCSGRSAAQNHMQGSYFGGPPMQNVSFQNSILCPRSHTKFKKCHMSQSKSIFWVHSATVACMLCASGRAGRCAPLSIKTQICSVDVVFLYGGLGAIKEDVLSPLPFKINVLMISAPWRPPQTNTVIPFWKIN